MSSALIHKFITFIITSVWLINGLYCKILNAVPRHESIVARILNTENARTLTLLIGIAEVLMGVWILTQFKSRINSIFQITIVVMMNILEFYLASDLLLWGKLNAFFALIFVLIIAYNEFILKQGLQKSINEFS